MPEIKFNTQKQGLGIITAQYDEDNHIGSGAMGDVFRGEGQLVSGQTVDVAIKLPETLEKEHLIEKEFYTLDELASSTRQATPRELGLAFTPEVQLGHRADTGRAALVMPLYKDKLADRVRQYLEAGQLLEADKLAIKYAIEYTYVFDGLHAMGWTCTDRKVGDLFIYENRLTVIDWNVLKIDDEANRAIEIGIAFGQIWYELYLGLRSLDTPIPLIDHEWQPATTEFEGGVPSVALRYVLMLALQPKLETRYKGEPKELRRVLHQLFDIIVRIDRQEVTTFPLDFFAPYHTLTEKEAAAILQDLIWRSKPDRDSSDTASRNKSVHQALRQSEPSELAATLADGDYRRANSDILEMQRRAQNTNDDVLYTRLERWKLLVEILLESNRDAATHIRDARQDLIEMWQALDSLWRGDTLEEIEQFENRIDELLRFIGSVQSAQYLEMIQSELYLRRKVLEYWNTTDAATRLHLLDTIESDLPKFPYLYNVTSVQKSLSYFSQVALDIDYERRENKLRIVVDEIIDNAINDIILHLKEHRFNDVQQRYLMANQDLAYHKLFERQVKLDAQVAPYRELAAFGAALQHTTSYSLGWKFRTAARLSKISALSETGLNDLPLQWIYSDLVATVGHLRRLKDTRNMTSVLHPETTEAYEALMSTQDIPEIQSLLLDVLEEIKANEDNLAEWINDYEQMRDFFHKLIKLQMEHTVRKRDYPDFEIRLMEDDEWIKILKRAYEGKIDMSDIFTILKQDEWRSFLNFVELEDTVKDYHDELRDRLGTDFRQILDEFKTQMDERTKTFQDKNREIETELAKLQRLSALSQINYYLVLGIAKAIAFDHEEADRNYYNADKLLKVSKTVLGSDYNQIAEQVRQLYALIQELVRMSQDRTEFDRFKRASRLIESGTLPEQDIHDTEFNASLQQNADKNPVIAILQDRYWALRLEKASQQAKEQAITTAVNEQQDELRRLLNDLDYYFYTDQPQRASQCFQDIIEHLKGDSLAKILVREIQRMWSIRLSEYKLFHGILDATEKVLVKWRSETSKRSDETAEEMLQVIDTLVDRMHQLPTDVFTARTFDRWDKALTESHKLYLAFFKGRFPNILIETAREYARVKMRPSPTITESIDSNRIFDL